MTKLVSFAACLSAFALAAAFFLFSPANGPVEAREDASQNCRVVQVALDEGYSISRIEERRVCN